MSPTARLGIRSALRTLRIGAVVAFSRLGATARGQVQVVVYPPPAGGAPPAPGFDGGGAAYWWRGYWHYRDPYGRWAYYPAEPEFLRARRMGGWERLRFYWRHEWR